jgi:hypothetical protein
MNTFSKFSIFGAVFILAFALWISREFNRSPYVLQTQVSKEQPVPFSHRHHVGGLGVDCRYCHTTVEESSFAGIPPTKTCMNCHSQIWTNSAMLEPVRESFRSDKAIRWNRVHNLAGFVYFNHSIHIKKGMGCVTCHGRVDQMPLTSQQSSLQMEWCLECHRNPEKFVRPRDQVFNMTWQWEEGKTQETEGPKLVQEYKINKKTSCSVCHR